MTDWLTYSPVWCSSCPIARRKASQSTCENTTAERVVAVLSSPTLLAWCGSVHWNRSYPGRGRGSAQLPLSGMTWIRLQGRDEKFAQLDLWRGWSEGRVDMSWLSSASLRAYKQQGSTVCIADCTSLCRICFMPRLTRSSRSRDPTTRAAGTANQSTNQSNRTFPAQSWGSC